MLGVFLDRKEGCLRFRTYADPEDVFVTDDFVSPPFIRLVTFV